LNVQWNAILKLLSMRSRGAFLAQNFDFEVFPQPLPELSHEYICLPCFHKEAIKLQLARLIFSEPQIAAIAQLNQAVIATFLRVSQPVISRTKADHECLDHPPEVLDGRRLLISLAGRGNSFNGYAINASRPLG
jgi:hypothetical protein